MIWYIRKKKEGEEERKIDSRNMGKHRNSDGGKIPPSLGSLRRANLIPSSVYFLLSSIFLVSSFSCALSHFAFVYHPLTLILSPLPEIGRYRNENVMKMGRNGMENKNRQIDGVFARNPTSSANLARNQHGFRRPRPIQWAVFLDCAFRF